MEKATYTEPTVEIVEVEGGEIWGFDISLSGAIEGNPDDID